MQLKHTLIAVSIIAAFASPAFANSNCNGRDNCGDTGGTVVQANPMANAGASAAANPMANAGASANGGTGIGMGGKGGTGIAGASSDQKQAATGVGVGKATSETGPVNVTGDEVEGSKMLGLALSEGPVAAVPAAQPALQQGPSCTTTFTSSVVLSKADALRLGWGFLTHSSADQVNVITMVITDPNVAVGQPVKATSYCSLYSDGTVGGSNAKTEDGPAKSCIAVTSTQFVPCGVPAAVVVAKSEPKAPANTCTAKRAGPGVKKGDPLTYEGDKMPAECGG